MIEQGAVLHNTDDKKRSGVLQEARRWLLEEGLRFYDPCPGQLKFHKSQGEVRILRAPNQHGKSFAGCVEIAYTVGKVHPYRPNYLGVVCARDCAVTLEKARTVLQDTYRRILPRKPCDLPWLTYEGKQAHWPGLRGGSWATAMSTHEGRLYLADNSFIEFKAYEQALDTFAGNQCHIIREDEECGEAYHTENVARQITLKRNIILTLTPLNYSQWIYAIHEKAESGIEPKFDSILIQRGESKFVSKEVLADMDKDITDPAERAARLFGEFTYAQGKVLTEFGDHNIVDPFPIPDEWHKSVIIDAHLNKSTAISWVAQDFGGGLWTYNEAEIKGDVKQICSEIAIRCAGQRIDLWLIDPSARQSTSIYDKGPMILEFRKFFPAILEANNNVNLGIDTLRKFFKNDVNGPKWKVMKNCQLTIFQLKNASWKPPLKSGETRGKPEIVKKNDEMFDTHRYRALARPEFTNAGSFTGFGVAIYGNG
jgi:phage terminase large subunit-like protein